MAGLILACLLLLSPAARAQERQLSPEDDQRARELFTHGQALYDQARYEEAVAAFQLAYNLSRRPLLLYNMASALERLGRWSEALEALQGYRETAPPEELETLDRRIAGLEEKVAAEQAQEEALRQAQETTVEPAPAVEERSGLRPATVALLGVGAAGLGTGAVFTVLALDARGDWTALCTDDRLCPASADPLVRKDRTRSLVADVGYAVGVVGVGAGVAISLGGGRDADLALVARPGRLGLAGRF